MQVVEGASRCGAAAAGVIIKGLNLRDDVPAAASTNSFALATLEN